MVKSFFAGVICCASVSAFADNAALTSGGQPEMLSHGHPTVRMKAEEVTMTLHYNRIDVDCTFYFQNTGPETIVKMGFPDTGLFAYSGMLGRTNFKSFHSFVDGKPVKTFLEVNKVKKQQWQAKQVPFPANGETVVREQYSTEAGGIGAGPLIALGNYIMHTGSSWLGSIGSAKLTIIVAPDTEVKFPLKLSVKALNELDKKSIDALYDRSVIYISGFTKPTVEGNKITLFKQDLKPTEADDVWIVWRIADRYMKETREKYRTK